MLECTPSLILALALLLVGASTARAAGVQFDATLPPAAFAAADISNALAGADAAIITLELDASLGAQAYQITRQGGAIRVRGGDARGLMYGGLELAEQIRVGGGLAGVNDAVGRPHIARRGLKFNIPLDIRNPSYQDAGDAAQNNIAEMWNFEFWREYLDAMARDRYNVLTLWNPHPFPSMIKLADYPDAALKDVCGTALPLDTDRADEPVAKFIAGCGISQAVLDDLIVLKPMTIEEKIAFWQRVMRYAKDRGIDVYFITWNIWMNSLAPAGWYRSQENLKGEAGLYGINNDQTNPRTIAYLRACVKEFILTYPDLAGIGFTPGENMQDRDDEFDREKWLWATYGQGVLDAQKAQPGRQVEIIHRVWQAGMPKIMDDFVRKYPGPIALSYKYTRARLHSVPDPLWAAAEIIPALKQYGVKSWWNLRNDDLFHFRWADPAYVSAFMEHLPPPELTAGYYMGSDSYVWGREFISVHPNSPRDLEIRKHWFNFLLWGRLGYDPDLSPERLTAIVQAHFPEADATRLLAAWSAASRGVARVNQFHWLDWDFMWAVEGCLDLRKGFHTVDDFITTKPLVGSGMMSIPDCVAARAADPEKGKLAPPAVANQLDADASAALAYVRAVRASDVIVSKELSELLYDIEALSQLAKYYAAKIRGATHLAAFRAGGSPREQELAVTALEESLAAWSAYARAATANYHPQFLAKTRTIDWVRLTEDVRKDIEIARSAKPQ